MAGQTIVDIFWQRVANTAERPAIMHKVAGAYRRVIWREHGRVVELVSGGLLHLGLQKGQKVAIMSNSRPQWTWADLAILSLGGVSVPVYPTLASLEAEYLLAQSDAVGVFVENDKQLEKILQIKHLPPQLRFIVLFEGEPVVTQHAVRILKWDDILKDGEVYLPNHGQEVQQRIDSIKADDLATIVYTSGTTGIPKGVMLSQGNIYSVCQAMSTLIGFRADDLALSFLPFSHIYERVGGQFLSIYEGLVMAYAESMETVAHNMMEVHPTIISGVPRFYEKVYTRIQSEIRKMPKPQQYLIRWALAIGKRAAKHKQQATNGTIDLINRIYRAELRVAERLVYSRIRNRFGGKVRFMVSGAAPLAPDVQLFFETIGISIIEGYGLTETCAPVSCNSPYGIKRGTVGRPLPGIEVKLASDGEIMVQGPTVFSGYYKNDEATRQAFKDGWFLTGDIGELDPDGYLKIKDRKKDIIITAGGKHVAPQFLENLFVSDSLISHILVYGDRRKYITALITLNADTLTAFAAQKEIIFNKPGDLTHHPIVLEEVESLVKRKNQRLATFEQIKKFMILDDDFTVENNELTPTLKVKRKVISERYKDILDSLYEKEDLEVEKS